MLNVYLIYRTDKWGYDSFDMAVVVAKNEDDAKIIHPGDGTYMDDYGTWCAPGYVNVEFIAKYTGKHYVAGSVICASFHAG